ncbi:MAG: hypothetical protein KI785_00520 [Devosiaceae bacterium]|nr:hypothetical protein [Devosiaceae bacterium MH13]
MLRVRETTVTTAHSIVPKPLTLTPASPSRVRGPHSRRPVPPRPPTAVTPTSPILRKQGIIQARCRQVEAAVATVFGVRHEALRGSSRGKATVARARQVAMYLCHTALGMSLTDVGIMFDRDRTTVAHACHLIEDARDEAAFDTLVTCLEHSLSRPVRVDAAHTGQYRTPSEGAQPNA